MTSSTPQKQIVLAGAGHAHLYVAKHADHLIRKGYQVTLIDPGRFWYSGLATGMLGGQYPPERDQVDARPLIDQAGGEFIQGKITSIQRDKKILVTDSGIEIEYDALSLNIGSTINDNSIRGSSQYGWHVKPISNLWTFRQKLENRFTGDHSSPLDLIVVGGGLTGCEIAANLYHLARKKGAAVNLTLLTHSLNLLPSQPEGASNKLARFFEEWGIAVYFDVYVSEIHNNSVRSKANRRFKADEIVLATGLRANSLIAESGLSTAADGSMLVNSNLQSIDDPAIFGAGDCIHIRDHPLPKLGVFAVRESPVLLKNLDSYLSGNPLEEYRPQTKYLSIMNLGNGTGLALRGKLYWFGRFSMLLKEYLDMRFLKRYQV